MKITYDLTSDVMCITFKKGKQVDSIEIVPGVILMIDDKKNILELEIIGAKEKMSTEWNKKYIDNLLIKYGQKIN